MMNSRDFESFQSPHHPDDSPLQRRAHKTENRGQSPQQRDHRILEDCTAFEYILLGDLRDLLDETPDELTSKWLRAVLDSLLDTLPRKFDLQDQGGYMTEVLEQFPNWYTQVDELRCEQQELYAKLRYLRARIAEEIPYASVAESLSKDLRDWMQSLTAFYRHERRIVQTAFNLEVGVGD